MRDASYYWNSGSVLCSSHLTLPDNSVFYGSL